MPTSNQASAAHWLQHASVLIEVNVDYAEPPPYVKGAGPQMFRNLAPRLKAGIALRLAKRYCFPPQDSES